jgi:hypothetical protein
LVAVVDVRNTAGAEQVSSVADNSGSSDNWQLASSQAQATGSQNDMEIWFTATPLTAAATTVTVTVPNNSTTNTGIVASVLDVTPSSPGSFTVNAANALPSSSNSTDASPLSDDSTSGDLGVTGMGWNGSTITDTVAPVSPGWSAETQRTNSLMGQASREEAAWEQAGSGTSTSVTDTLSASDAWANVIADLQFAPQASGTITEIQNFGGTDSALGTTVSAPVPTLHSTTAGDLLVANIVSRASTAPTVSGISDDGSNVWFLAAAEQVSGILDEEVWYSNTTASDVAGTNITATVNESAGSSLEVTEFNSSTTGTFNVWNANPSNDSAATTSIAGDSSNPDSNEDLGYVGIATKNRQGTNPSWTLDSLSGTSWQGMGENTETSPDFNFEQSVWDTTGVESVGFTATLVSSSPWTAIPVLFNFNAGGSTTPTVTSVSPSTNSIAPDGYIVDVSGTGFSGETDVKLGTTDVQSTVSVTSNRQLSFTVPAAEAAGTYTVYVTNGSGTNSSGATLQVVTSPYIEDFSPTSGPESTTSVVLDGWNLGTTSTATVKLGTTPATVTANSGSFGQSLTFTVPTIANGSYTISDTVGGNTGTSSTQFTVNTSTWTPPHIMLIELENAGYNDTLGTCVTGSGHFACDTSNESACGSGSSGDYADALDPYFCYLADHYTELNNWTSAINGYAGTTENNDCDAANNGPACHPSEKNYLAITGGQTDGCTQDNCSANGSTWPYGGANNNNNFNQLTGQGIPWVDYSESMTGNCEEKSQDGLYVGRHNPAMLYTDLTVSSTQCSNYDQPLPATPTGSGSLQSDLDAVTGAPDFVFIAPNIEDDDHGCNTNNPGGEECNESASNALEQSMNNWMAPSSGSECGTGNPCVQAGSINACSTACVPDNTTGLGWIPAILNSTWFTGSTPATVIITMDESDHPGATNIVPMVLISNQAGNDLGRTSTVTPFSGGGSYSTLASIEKAYHLSTLGPGSNLTGLDNFLCNGGSC